MTLTDKALVFAMEQHSGQVRKMTNTPYVLHPCEVASILASMTDDENVIAAGLLHDTIEDCGVTPETIQELFGVKVFALVQSETEDKLADKPPEETWMQRKEDSLLVLKNTKNIGVKMLWLSDKLANLRSLWIGKQKFGDAMWEQFHQKDPKMHAWYYRSVAQYTTELSDTGAYREFTELIQKTFGGE